MGFLSDLTDFLFGWLIPEQPKPDLGIDVTKADTDAHIPVAYGRCYGGGLIVYQATNDADNDDVQNDLLHQVVVWSEGICGGVLKNFVDDELSTSVRFNADDGFKWFYAENFTNGLLGFTDPLLTLSGRRGTDTFDGKLVSYCRSEMTDGEVWSGPPNHKAEFNGRLISAPTEIVGITPEFIPSENPVDQLFDLLKSPIYGKGLSSDFIDIGSFAASRPVCDTLVETYPASGVNRKLFTSNIILDTSNTVLDNVNTLLKSMRGWLFHSDGKLKLLIEKDDAPVDFSIDENDQGFIEFGEVKNSSKSNRYNRVVCRYTDPDSGWTQQEVIYPEPGSAEETALLAEDNGVLLEKSIALDTCIYYHEAAHHAKTILQISREQLRTSVTWGPEAVILEVGDIVPVTRSALGWDGKLFRIETTEKSTQDGTVQLKLREHQPYLYDDANLGDKPVLPDTNIVYDRPAAPFNVTVTGVFDKLEQIRISFSSATIDHRIVVANFAGDQVLNTVFAGKSYALNGLALGDYTFSIYAIGGLGRSSVAYDGVFSISVPTEPTVTVYTTALEAQIVPKTLGALVGQQYELEFGSTVNQVDAVNYGLSGAFTVSGLQKLTNYYYWVRAVNYIGTSAWVSGSFTTTGDATAILDLVGEDIAAQILPDVTSAVEQDLQNVVDASLVDYSTTLQVDTKIDTALEEIGVGEGEDGRLSIIEHVNSIFKEQEIARVVAKNKASVESDLNELNGLFPIQEVSIDDNSISAPKIQANAISADKIVANSITGDKIAANSITATNIASESITSSEIAAGAITAVKIVAGAIAADKIAANAVVADKIAANAITSVKIDAAAITAAKIDSEALNGKLITGTILRTAADDGGNNFRVVTGDPSLPLWYGAGSVSSANGSFYVNDLGTIYAKNMVIEGDSIFRGSLNAVGGTFSGQLTVDKPAESFGSSIKHNASVTPVLHLSNYAYPNSSLNLCGGIVVDAQGYSQFRTPDENSVALYVDNFSPFIGTGAALRAFSLKGTAIKAGGEDFAFYATEAGYGPFTGCHDGLILKEQAYTQGDLICDVSIVSSKGISNVITEITPTSSAMQKSAVGVIVKPIPFNDDSLPAAMETTMGYEETHDRVIFNAVGEGMMNVCGEGGDIQAGDLITSSNTPGKGMKQMLDTVHNYTVAKSRQSVTFSTPSEIKQIAVIYMCG